MILQEIRENAMQLRRYPKTTANDQHIHKEKKNQQTERLEHTSHDREPSLLPPSNPQPFHPHAHFKPRISSLQPHNPSRLLLTTVLRTSTAIRTALAALLAHEATAQRRNTRLQAALPAATAPPRRRLLLLRRVVAALRGRGTLLVVHWLLRLAVAGASGQWVAGSGRGRTGGDVLCLLRGWGPVVVALGWTLVVVSLRGHSGRWGLRLCRKWWCVSCAALLTCVWWWWEWWFC